MPDEVKDDAEAPKAGGITFCLNCGEILEFTADMQLRKLPAGVLDAQSPARRDYLRHVSGVLKLVREQDGPMKPPHKMLSS